VWKRTHAPQNSNTILKWEWYNCRKGAEMGLLPIGSGKRFAEFLLGADGEGDNNAKKWFILVVTAVAGLLIYLFVALIIMALKR
jgi:hypothetical protein